MTNRLSPCATCSERPCPLPCPKLPVSMSKARTMARESGDQPGTLMPDWKIRPNENRDCELGGTDD